MAPPNYPARYHWPEPFRFRHVRPGHVFRITEESATAEAPAGYYVRASVRKALPCTYSEFDPRPHVRAEDGVRYVPLQLPVVQVQV